MDGRTNERAPEKHMMQMWQFMHCYCPSILRWRTMWLFGSLRLSDTQPHWIDACSVETKPSKKQSTPIQAYSRRLYTVRMSYTTQSANIRNRLAYAHVDWRSRSPRQSIWLAMTSSKLACIQTTHNFLSRCHRELAKLQQNENENNQKFKRNGNLFVICLCNLQGNGLSVDLSSVCIRWWFDCRIVLWTRFGAIVAFCSAFGWVIGECDMCTRK